MSPKTTSYRRWLCLLVASPLLLTSFVLWVAVQLTMGTGEARTRADLFHGALLVQKSLEDAETGQRGFLITGNETYLGPYRLALAEIPSQMDRLRTLASGMPDDAASVARITQLKDKKLTELAAVIEVRRRTGFEAAKALVVTDTGRQLMDELRHELDGIADRNAGVVEARRNSRQQMLISIEIGGVLILLMTGVGLWGLYRVGRSEEAARTRPLMELLEQSNQRLDEFAHMAAHDLRAPARSSLGLLQLARRKMVDPISSESVRLLNLLEDSLSAQTRLIDSLLVYQRITHAEIPPPVAVDLHEPLSRATLNLRELIRSTDAEIVHSDLPTVQGNVEQLTLLFQNLMENAIKYRRPDRAPRIEIRGLRTHSEWIITIQDNGQGFDQEHAIRVFRPFERLHDSNASGSGIGLATCMKIVQGHGGRIWATSDLGKGSEFCFALPVGATATA